MLRETTILDFPDEQDPQPSADTTVVQAVVGGEADRYRELVERYQPLAYAVAWGRLGDHDLAEEAVQEAFLIAYQHLGSLRRATAFPSWLARITRGVALRMAKRRTREQKALQQWALESGFSSAPAALAADEPGLLSTQDREAFQSVMAQLPAASRECLTLFYAEERAVAECARMLGVTEGAFKVRLHRARTRLGEQVSGQVPHLAWALRRASRRPAVKAQILAGIAALPATAGAAGAAGTSGGTASGMGLGGLLLKFPALVQAGVTFGLIGWANRELAENYRSGQSWRREILRHGFWALVGTILLLLLVQQVAMRNATPQTLYLALGIYTGLAFLHGLWLLRTAATPFHKVSAAGVGLMAAGFLGIARLDWHPATFFGVMLIYNAMLAGVWKSVPRRGDYNLLLRALKGGLGTGTEGGTAKDASSGVESGLSNRVEATRSPSSYTEADVRSFIRFLGLRYLAGDHQRTDEGWTAYLPTVRTSPLRAFIPLPPRWQALSTLLLDERGVWQVRCSSADARSLTALAEREDGTTDVAQLERRAAAAVAAAFERYLDRDQDGAARAVEAQSDEEVFIRPTGSLRRQRILIWVSVVAAGIAFVIQLFVR